MNGLSQDVTKGQTLINKWFGATPENPLIIPIANVPVDVTFSNKATVVIIGSIAIVSLTILLASALKK